MLEDFSSKDEIIFVSYITNILGLYFKYNKVILPKEGIFFGLNEGKVSTKYILKFRKRKNNKWEIEGYGYPVLVEKIVAKFKELVSQDVDFSWASDHCGSTIEPDYGCF